MPNSQQPRYMNDENELNQHFVAESPKKKSFWEAFKEFFSREDLTYEEWERLEYKNHYRDWARHHLNTWRF